MGRSADAVRRVSVKAGALACCAALWATPPAIAQTIQEEGGRIPGIPESSIASSLPDHLADPGGIRSRLGKRGIQVGLHYIGEVLGNPSGGIKQSAHYSGLLQVAVEADLEKMIGWSGLQFLSETGEVEIAYLIAKPYWGQGLATESAHVGLTFGFENIGLHQIVAIVQTENFASQRVVQKLGMNFVDQSRYFGMVCFRYAMHRQTFGGLEGCQKK